MQRFWNGIADTVNRQDLDLLCRSNFAFLDVFCSILSGIACFLCYKVNQIMYMKYVTTGEYARDVGL